MSKYLPGDVFRQAMTIIIVSSVLGLGSNKMNPHRVNISFSRPNSVVADSSFGADFSGVDVDSLSALAASEPVQLNIRQVKWLVEQGEAVLIDARSEQAFRRGHIPGAINIPYQEVDRYQERIDRLPGEKWLICFCDGPPCDLGELLAFELFARGFPRVAIYQAGMKEWMELGEAVEGEE